MDAARPRQFVIGESSGSQRPQPAEQWDVHHFWKNGGEIFYGSDDPEESLLWLDTAGQVLEHIGCPLEIWVRVANGAMQRDSKVWWEAMRTG